MKTLLTIKCESKQLKQARKLLGEIKKQTGESHIFIILRLLGGVK